MTVTQCNIDAQMALPDTETYSECGACGLPVCGQCDLQRSHHSLECDFVQRSGSQVRDKLSSLLEGLSSARLVLTRQRLRARPGGLDQSLCGLSRGNGDIPDMDEGVMEAWRPVMGDTWDEEEFRLCYEQLFINGKSLADIPGVRGTGLYLLFSVMNHSCLANTVTVVSRLTGAIQVKAPVMLGPDWSIALLLSSHWSGEGRDKDQGRGGDHGQVRRPQPRPT